MAGGFRQLRLCLNRSGVKSRPAVCSFYFESASGHFSRSSESAFRSLKWELFFGGKKECHKEPGDRSALWSALFSAKKSLKRVRSHALLSARSFKTRVLFLAIFKWELIFALTWKTPVRSWVPLKIVLFWAEAPGLVKRQSLALGLLPTWERASMS